jgi:hypothetical protein
MFRKLFFASVASLGLLAPLAVPATAGAHEVRVVYPEHRGHACRVYYREPCRPAWVFAGTFHGHRAAERCAAGFRCRGFEVVIR